MEAPPREDVARDVPNPAADADLLCPLCEYDLRGQTEPRCPECGYRFTWEELNSPERRLHPYLFEHHPERNARAFRQTLLGGLRPKRFWRTLFPTQPSRPRRLLLYWLLVAAACVSVSAVQMVRTIVAVDADQAKRQAASIQAFPSFDARFRALALKQHGTVQAWAAVGNPRWPDWWFVRNLPQAHLVQNLMIGTILWLAWPWVTLAGLMIFQASMRRAQVRPIHVLRCVVYTGDVALLWSLAMAAVLVWDVSQNGIIGGTWGFSPSANVIPMITTVALLLATWRLAAAYKHYLRFEHAWATAIAVQIMVALLVAKLAVDWEFIF